MHQTLWILAIGTLCFRVAGPFFADQLSLTTRWRSLLSEAAIVLLCALAAVSSIWNGDHFAGWARPIGVLVGVLLAARQAAFPVVVIAAACATAGLRYFGLA
jgi:branched-subunit amino acid transport protein